MLISVAGVIEDGSTPISAVPTQQNVSAPQGVDAIVELTITGSNGSALNLTTYLSFSLVLKTAPVGGKTLATLVGTATSPSTGVVHFTLPAATTKALNPGMYVFDIFTVNATGLKDEPMPNSWLSVTSAVGA